MTSPTYTDETVEKAAEAIWLVGKDWDTRESWSTLPDYGQDLYRDQARAALSVRPSTGSDAGDLMKRLIDLSNHLLRLDSLSGEGYLTREAAASIAALSEENERLKAALEMIAAIDPQVYFKNHNPSSAPGFIGPHATIAAEALAKLGQMKGEG